MEMKTGLGLIAWASMFHSSGKTLSLVLLLALFTGCIPTSSAKKVLSQGLEIEPNSTVMIIWEHEKKFPLSESIIKAVEDQFIERNIQLLNYHDWEIQRRLQINPQIKRSVTIDQIKEKMNVDYLFRFYIDRLIEGEGTEYYLPEFNTFYFEPDERYTAHVYTDVISIRYESLFARYKSTARNNPIELPARGGGTYKVNFGGLRSTTIRASEKAVKKILKNHYNF